MVGVGRCLALMGLVVLVARGATGNGVMPAQRLSCNANSFRFNTSVGMVPLRVFLPNPSNVASVNKPSCVGIYEGEEVDMDWWMMWMMW